MTDETPTPLPAGGQNAIAVTFGLLGDEWTLLILRYAHQGVRRYQDWREQLPISDAVLTGRLARMTEQGLLTRAAYQERPVRYEYRLTPRGRALWPVLVTVWGWEFRWVAGQREELPWTGHHSCGRHSEPVLVCDACGGQTEPRDVRSALGPSGDAGRSVPAGATRRRSISGDGGAAGLFPETTALIGNRWSVALLGSAFLGDQRFGEFQQRLGAPPTVIADRLKTFCARGVLRATGTTYRLTAKGRAFFPVVMTLIDWGQRWYAAPEGPALVSVHRPCGREFRPRLVCGVCGERLVERDVVISTGVRAAP
ncbi:helix-turn-helix transcriptional regulator [Streptomyces sp. NBC_01142]|uniref:winged helix-turn-helix transcriptional regulator n=1 Tax=Streptomyces sp. NBC_01142 TaxID=2975865 RepID=UPI00224EA778|nr:helix-turn-helix domain-containing protein [Streptomyces sp. NBC_01142]MCX4820827.1 helix-turn-helix transcriptional regulator [Streptomyces sp. NBC_01142]